MTSSNLKIGFGGGCGVVCCAAADTANKNGRANRRVDEGTSGPPVFLIRTETEREVYQPSDCLGQSVCRSTSRHQKSLSESEVAIKLCEAMPLAPWIESSSTRPGGRNAHRQHSVVVH